MLAPYGVQCLQRKFFEPNDFWKYTVSEHEINHVWRSNYARVANGSWSRDFVREKFPIELCFVCGNYILAADIEQIFVINIFLFSLFLTSAISFELIAVADVELIIKLRYHYRIFFDDK